MNIKNLLLVSFISSSIYLSPVFAAADVAQLKKTLAPLLPNANFNSLRQSPIPGLYEIEVNTRIMYVSEDGKYLISGNLYDMTQRKDLTGERRGKIVAELIDNVGEKNMVVIGPKRAKRSITVFTDVDCPYCSKLHLEVPQLNAAGVKVRYLLYPRQGLQSNTYKRSVSVWCASDRAKAIGIAKAGGKVNMKTCNNPVSEHYQLGQRIGISGTPTIITDEGAIIGGYVPAAKLLNSLDPVSAKTK